MSEKPSALADGVFTADKFGALPADELREQCEKIENLMLQRAKGERADVLIIEHAIQDPDSRQ